MPRVVGWNELEGDRPWGNSFRHLMETFPIIRRRRRPHFQPASNEPVVIGQERREGAIEDLRQMNPPEEKRSVVKQKKTS